MNLWHVTCVVMIIRCFVFLARDAFVPCCHDVCLSVCPSVHLSGTGMHCDYTVHFGADLSFHLDSSLFWLP